VVDADWITKGATLLSADWKAFDGEIVGLVLVLGAVLAPVYLTLQAWFGYAWTGRWRIAALIPLAGLVVFTCFNLRAPVNITDPLAAVMLFAPLGSVYLAIAGIARAIFHANDVAPGAGTAVAR
jgi:hypothetical protein